MLDSVPHFVKALCDAQVVLFPNIRILLKNIKLQLFSQTFRDLEPGRLRIKGFLSTILAWSTFAPDSLISRRYYRCARAVLRRHFIFFDQRSWYERRAQRPVQRTLCRHTTSRMKARRLRKRAAPSAHGQLLQPMYRLARSSSTR